VIPLRRASLAFAVSVAIAASAFTPFTVTVAAANPVPPFRIAQVVTATPPKFVPPSFGALVPYQQPAGAQNPVIAYRHGQLIHVLPASVVQPFVGKVSSIQPPAVTPFRYGRLAVPVPVPVVPPSVGRVLAAPETPAPANPVPGLRVGQLIERAPQTPVRAGHSPFPFVSAEPAAPANPVISVRIGQLISVPPPPLPRTGYGAVVPYQESAPANPVIAMRVGQWVGAGIPPVIGVYGYQKFPWVSAEIPPAVVDISGGDDAPRKRRKPKPLVDIYQEIQRTIHALITGESDVVTHPIVRADAATVEVRQVDRALDRLLALARDQRIHSERIEQIQHDLRVYQQWLLDQDDEDWELFL
jgi:hypothetical protein